jgi:hypothetical protein
MEAYMNCETSRLPHNWFTDDSDIVSLTRGHILLPGRFLVLISVRCWVDPRAIVQLVELGQLKNLVASSGIEPWTFWLVALCINKLRYRVPHLEYKEAFQMWSELKDLSRGRHETAHAKWILRVHLPSTHISFLQVRMIVAWFGTGFKTTSN